MNSLAPPPSPAPAAADPPGRSRVPELSPRQFRTLMLAIVAAAALMGAEGVQTFAEMRERHYTILARQQAVSPVSYGTQLPALNAMAPAGAGARVLVRSDSAGPQAAALCALAAGTAADPKVGWIAFSADVDACVARRVGARMVRAGSPAAAEMGRARWMVMDADGRALYSRAGVPSIEQLRRTAALLAPLAPGEAAP